MHKLSNQNYVFKKVNNKYRKNLILQSIKIKSKETRVVAVIWRYSSRLLIPIFQTVAVAKL